MLNCFNSSQMGPEFVPYIKMAKIGPHFENEQPRLYLFYFFPKKNSVAYPTAGDLASALQVSHLHLL